MSLRTNIVCRGSRYYVRLSVPKDLQQAYGKKNVRRSLGTSDPSEAARLGTIKLAETHAEFEEFRRRRKPTDDELKALIWASTNADLRWIAENALQCPTGRAYRPSWHESYVR